MSWEKLKSIENYSDKAGELIFLRQVGSDTSLLTTLHQFISKESQVLIHLFFLRCRIFELEPETRKLFDFEPDEDVKSNLNFSRHARAMVDMMDCAVSLLGPDLDPLMEDLNDLGKRHIGYGVKVGYLPLMEKAVMYAMDEMLDLSKEERSSWQIVFHFLITNMSTGMKK